MAKETLEQIYKKSESFGGDCPLPEPGSSGTQLEHIVLTSVREQPKDYDYDNEENAVEWIQFEKRIWQAVADNQITEEKARKLLTVLQN